MISASMWSLMTGLKDLFETQMTTAGTLSQVRQVKRGMLPPRGQFPTISIVPVRETYERLNSGRRATIRKAIDITLYWRDLRGAEGISDMQAHVDEMVTLIESARQLPSGGTPRAMSMSMGGVDVMESEIGDRVYTSAGFEVSYLNKEDLPDPTVTYDGIDDPGVKDIAAAIYANLQADSTITGQANVYPLPFGPFNYNRHCIVVEPGSETHSMTFAGADELSQDIKLNIMTPVVRHADTEMQSHLALVESMKSRLWADINLGGRAMSRVTQIFHGSMVQNSKAIYASVAEAGVTAKMNVTPA